MAGLNKVMIIGNLGRDPELTYTQSGAAICKIAVATSETWNDKNSGEKKEKTEWHRLVAWGRQAEIVGEYLTKGSLIYIEGQLQTRKWTDQEDNERYTTEIRVGMMKMLGGGSKSNGDSSERHEEPAAETVSAPAEAESPGDPSKIPF